MIGFQIVIYNFILILLVRLQRDVVPIVKINGLAWTGLLNGKVLIFR
jgi:hypothetical protein